MGFLNNLFRKSEESKQFKTYEKPNDDKPMEKIQQSEEDIENWELNSYGTVDISIDGILDTTSPQAIKKLKYNLNILIQKAKEMKRIDKFMIIRDDNFLPKNWNWQILSNNTQLEKVGLSLCVELKIQYALEKANIISKINGISIPVDEEKITTSLASVDPTLGFVYLPARFRSTKHFTINTPLEVTGDYNFVDANRNFTIIDDINNFINSGYAYSVSYHDAYLDVSHESLPISKNAIILIEQSKYKKLMEDSKIKNQLKDRQVIIYIGEEYLAINMVLSELGVLPSKIGALYATYDKELNDILDKSIRNLAKSNNILYDKSHGSLRPNDGHFTNYYDAYNNDFYESLRSFVNFLRTKFPEQKNMITETSITEKWPAQRVIQAIGTEKLLKAIEEYNDLAQKEFSLKEQKYYQDRANITPEISNIFKLTVRRINTYFEIKENYNYSLEMQKRIEELIRHFLQDNTVQEQLLAAECLWKILRPIQKLNDMEETNTYIAQEKKENLKM